MGLLRATMPEGGCLAARPAQGQIFPFQLFVFFGFFSPAT